MPDEDLRNEQALNFLWNLRQFLIETLNLLREAYGEDGRVT